MEKLWRYNGFNPETRTIIKGFVYKNPEVIAQTSPGADYTQIEFETPAKYLRDQVLANPNNSYRLYKWLHNDVAATIKDVTIPPKGIRYKTQTNPLVQKRRKVINARGALSSLEYWIYDTINNIWVEMTHKLTFIWTYSVDAPFKTGESILYSKQYIQYVFENGQFSTPYTIDEIYNGVDSQGVAITDITGAEIESHETDIKYTYKRFHLEDDKTKPDYALSSIEGVRRRENVSKIGEVGFITLTALLVTGGNQTLAENLGMAMIRKYSDEYDNYQKSGDRSFIDLIETNGAQFILTDILGNEIMPGVSSISLLDTPIPATVNLGQGPIPIEAIVPGANTTPFIRNYIAEKYKGNI